MFFSKLGATLQLYIAATELSHREFYGMLLLVSFTSNPLGIIRATALAYDEALAAVEEGLLQ